MSSPARLRTRRLKVVAVVAALAGGIAAAPSAANADFTLNQCGGSDVAGVGASFQNVAQKAWTDLFATVCNGAPAISQYNGAGSGVGRAALGERGSGNTAGARSNQYRYAAADEAPTTAQRTQIEKGPIANDVDVTASDDGKLHVIPAAVGATTMIVNYPDNCTLGTATDGAAQPRLRLTSTVIEAMWAGDASADTWGEVVPDIAGANGRTTPECAGLPVIRVVRTGDSGTTYSLKSWLATINAPRGWGDATYGASPNYTWPVGGNPQRAPQTSGQCSPASFCAGSNAGTLAGVVNDKDGSIGYADLASARAGGFTKSSATDDTYWLSVEGKDSTAQTRKYNEPNLPAGAPNPNALGANCASATFTGVPADTFGDFSKVTAANSPTGYPLCVVTYMLAWDDNAAVYGIDSAGSEQRAARTVKDYLDMIVTTGQGVLASSDYAPLPPQLLAVARNGVKSISWNKAGAGTAPTDPGTGGGNTPPAGGGTTAPGAPTPPPATVPPVVTAPSNVFTVQSATVSKTGTLSATLRLPGAGAVAVKGTAKSGRRTITVGSAKGTANAAGNLVVKLTPSSKAKAALRKAGKLKVKLVFTFAPAGGSPGTVERTVTFKAKKAKKAKRKSTKKQAARR